MLDEGKVFLIITIDPAGNVKSARVAKSSGSATSTRPGGSPLTSGGSNPRTTPAAIQPRKTNRFCSWSAFHDAAVLRARQRADESSAAAIRSPRPAGNWGTAKAFLPTARSPREICGCESAPGFALPAPVALRSRRSAEACATARVLRWVLGCSANCSTSRWACIRRAATADGRYRGEFLRPFAQPMSRHGCRACGSRARGFAELPRCPENH